MSRRTAQASKAVRDAWKEEQERVRMGKGTRDWTQEQQKEILELGRAYYHSDDPNDINDGKAFEGHHMKSVEAYPEFQGDSANIQFLSKPEHIEAHRGDYKNASNWYFDPVTHEFTDFGEGKYIPCTVIDLSDPIKIITVDTSENGTIAKTKPAGKTTSAEERSTTTSSEHSEEKPKESTTPKKKSEEPPPKPPKPSTAKTKPEPLKSKIEPPKKPGFLSRVRKRVNSVWTETVSPVITDTIWPYVKEHPLQTITGVITTVGGIVGVFSQSTSNNGDSEKSFTSDILRSEDKYGSDYPKPDISDLDSTQNEEKEEADIAADTSERPYTPNDVPAGGQHYHYKDGSVKWKEKGPYSRGKKKKDEE
jgi:ElaB/YqjD/DUF883 family membrane-anchored ribosome-binding protein